jgi:hypothetical protein
VVAKSVAGSRVVAVVAAAAAGGTKTDEAVIVAVADAAEEEGEGEDMTMTGIDATTLEEIATVGADTTTIMAVGAGDPAAMTDTITGEQDTDLVPLHPLPEGMVRCPSRLFLTDCLPLQLL